MNVRRERRDTFFENFRHVKAGVQDETWNLQGYVKVSVHRRLRGGVGQMLKGEKYHAYEKPPEMPLSKGLIVECHGHTSTVDRCSLNAG